MKEENNVYYENKKNRITFSQIIVLIIVILIFIILILETKNLVLYTIGEKSREEAVLYNFIYKIANKSKAQNDLKSKEEYSLNLGILGNINCSNEILNKSLNNGDFTEIVKKYDLAITNISNNISKINQNDIQETLNNNNIKSIDYENGYYILEKNNIKIGIFLQDLESTQGTDNVESQEIINILKQNDVDLIICFLCNKKDENYKFVTEIQTNTVDELFENGTDIVIGINSQNFQSFTEDNIELSNDTKHVYCIYSMGNLIDSSNNNIDSFSLLSGIEISKVVYKQENMPDYTKVVTYQVDIPKLLYGNINKNYMGIYLVENITDNNNLSNKILEEIEENTQRYKAIYNNY